MTSSFWERLRRELKRKNSPPQPLPRLFDHLANVPENYFAAVRAIDTDDISDDGTDEKVINGNGLQILSLPPFVGNITSVVYQNGTSEMETVNADTFKVSGLTPNRFLETYRERYFDSFRPFDYQNLWTPDYGWRNTNVWRENANYTVRARWGFEAVPADVKTAVIQMAISIMSDLDLAKTFALEAKADEKNHLPDHSFAAITARKYRQSLGNASGF